jgi:hypothetical protein
MDEWTGQPDDQRLARFGRRLEAAAPTLLEALGAAPA